MELQCFLATKDDVPMMAEMRIAFILELMGDQPTEDIEMLRGSLIGYFTRTLADGTYIGWYAKAGGLVAGTGGIVMREQPGNFKNPSGRIGYIMNMYTIPTFRKRGICAMLINKLMDSARARGINAFELHATKEGAAQYEKQGFLLHGEPTYRKIDIL